MRRYISLSLTAAACLGIAATAFAQFDTARAQGDGYGYIRHPIMGRYVRHPIYRGPVGVGEAAGAAIAAAAAGPNYNYGYGNYGYNNYGAPAGGFAGPAYASGYGNPGYGYGYGGYNYGYGAPAPVQTAAPYGYGGYGYGGYGSPAPVQTAYGNGYGYGSYYASSGRPAPATRAASEPPVYYGNYPRAAVNYCINAVQTRLGMGSSEARKAAMRGAVIRCLEGGPMSIG
jgi:hypothetical protein